MPRLVIAKWRRMRFPTTEVQKLIPQMPFEILDKPVKIRGGTRTEHLRRILPHRMRLMEIAKSVTQLIDEERVEFSYYRGYEVRQYAERLISEAIRYGDCHKATMELADFYLNDKTLVHKLFKVLVPRYMNYTTSFTNMYILANRDIDWSQYHLRAYVGQRVVIELKENPYPSLLEDEVECENLLHNILLAEYAKDYRFQKNQEQKSN
ncbi:39S ribosomal protein L17 [Sarcoptes scabiei]|uniref:Large ribosomal subunit protein bL17m n=1 Tax=Sarcoptes scabiei TaxID=52283 RepID=A0A132AAU3_SARSC|nr:39S ribosomal protein L17 [Sarcoptes scabiei]KPM08111.1 39S ribosomal protein L17, mitochondrial-like protein [Sarcoptes scabiei]UXI17363.1 3-ketodihydrosphingosine reductase [Sarcoptes scabiei]